MSFYSWKNIFKKPFPAKHQLVSPPSILLAECHATYSSFMRNSRCFIVLIAPSSLPPQQTTAVNKSSNKKTWSQRLKLNSSSKNDKSKIEKPTSATTHHFISPGIAAVRGGYADPWLYGTVRGVPTAALPMYQQQHPMFYASPVTHRVSAEVAVVVCSCPEYLNGTKKEVKKASVCKKCKGSRLPLAAIGGTVRLAPSSGYMNSVNPSQFYGSMAVGRMANPEVRLQSSTVAVRAKSNARPTILGDDPYDQMRRSRLGTPLVTSPVGYGGRSGGSLAGTAKMGRHRAKSSSPTRNLRSAPQAVAAPVKQVQSPLQRRSLVEESVSGGADRVTLRSRSMGRLNARNSFPGYQSTENQLTEDLWIDSHDATDTDSSASPSTRSILHCYSDLNPYDLVSSAMDAEEEEENHYDLYEGTTTPSGDSLSTLKTRSPQSTEKRLDLHSRKYENLLNASFDRQRKQHQEPIKLTKGQSTGRFQRLSDDSVNRVSPSLSTEEQQKQARQKQKPTDEAQQTIKQPSEASTGSSPLRPPRKMGMCHVRLRPEKSATSPPTKCEAKTNPVVKSILKKYENVTFQSQDDSVEPEGDQVECSESGLDSAVPIRKYDSELEECLSDTHRIRIGQLVNGKTGNKKGTHFLCAHAEEENIGRYKSSSCSKSNASFLPRKKVQFCEEDETFSDDDRDEFEKGHGAEQTATNSREGCDKPEINNCRLVAGSRRVVEDEAEEQDDASSTNKIGHNCDISTEKVPNHKSSEESDGAAGEQPERDMGVDSLGVRLPGHDDHQEFGAADVTLHSTSNPTARETSTLGTLLSGRVPIQGKKINCRPNWSTKYFVPPPASLPQASPATLEGICQFSINQSARGWATGLHMSELHNILRVFWMTMDRWTDQIMVV